MTPLALDGLASLWGVEAAGHLPATKYEGIIGVGSGAEVALMLLARAEAAKRAPFLWAVVFGGGDGGWASALRERAGLFAAPLQTTPVFAVRGAGDDPGFQNLLKLVSTAQLECAAHSDAPHLPFPGARSAAVALAGKIATFVARVTMDVGPEVPDARLTTPALPIPVNTKGS